MSEQVVPDFIVSAVVIRDVAERTLVVRKAGTERYLLPGGKIELGARGYVIKSGFSPCFTTKTHAPM